MMNQNSELSPGSRKIMIKAKHLARDFCHDFITTEHILLAILEAERPGKGVLMMQDLEINIDDFKSFVIQNLKKYKNPKKPELKDIEPSERVLKMISFASSIAKEMDQKTVYVDHLLLSILVSDAGSGNNLFRLKNIDANFLYEAIYIEIQPKKRKKSKQAADVEEDVEDVPYTQTDKDNILDKYTTNLTHEAALGMIDPVIGREHEVNNMMQIITRRTKNNPVLIGEPGVGKTAVVEALAQQIVTGDVPVMLRNKQIYTLDLTRLVAGTIYRGQFEERLKDVIAYVQSRDDILLFIDELHMLVGAGSGAGSMDASNILKPALARGKICCIGATTLQEYKEYIEGDGALERRFQTVMVDEPVNADVLQILKGVKHKYETHHHVKYNNQCLNEIVTLCERYMPEKQFPDKAIDVLDQVGSMLNMSRYTPDQQTKQMKQQLDEAIQNKNRCVERGDFDTALGYRETEYELLEQLAMVADEQEQQQYNNRKYIKVLLQDVRSVISDKCGIDLSDVDDDETTRLLTLPKRINRTVVGQTHAVDKICDAINRSRVGINDPDKPICSLLFLGPTGVGKTHLARTLGQEIFIGGGFRQYNMSEFAESHTVSKLIGSPPGYVGFGSGGDLTEYVRHTPYSVLLFDEIEKAHVDVLQLFLQILEYGVLTDSDGLEVNFKNCIIIMTSNIGAHKFEKRDSVGFGQQQNTTQSVIDELKKMYAPEFVNRFDELIVFNKLKDENILNITKTLLKQLKNNIRKTTKRTITFDDTVVSHVISKCADHGTYGARPLKRVITEHVETPLAKHLLTTDTKRVQVVFVDEQIQFK